MDMNRKIVTVKSRRVDSTQETKKGGSNVNYTTPLEKTL